MRPATDDHATGIAVPLADAFAHLHADCLMVWNEERLNPLGRARTA